MGRCLGTSGSILAHSNHSDDLIAVMVNDD